MEKRFKVTSIDNESSFSGYIKYDIYEDNKFNQRILGLLIEKWVLERRMAKAASFMEDVVKRGFPANPRWEQHLVMGFAREDRMTKARKYMKNIEEWQKR